MTECGRCGTEYDPDRETERSGFDSTRCPSCGQRNAPQVAETDGGTVETPAVPGAVADTLTEIDRDGGELHVHFHFDG